MTDPTSFRSQPPSVSTNMHGFQFSLMSVFRVATAVAIVLAAVFGVGRLLGMSLAERR